MARRHYDWVPTARKMEERIRLAIREHGEDAAVPILDAVADTMLAVDYPVPIETCIGTKRSYGAALIESAADWFRNVLKDD